MPMCASSRPPPISTATAAASSSLSPSTKASATGSAPSTSRARCPRSMSTTSADTSSTRSGRVYNAEKVEKTVEALTIGVSLQGYAFGQVKPRFDRDETNHIMNITFVIDEGPRIYIERINIVGNFRTEDNVIRRQFRLAEGDAFNRLLVEAARKRLRALGFFKTVEVETAARQRARPGDHRGQGGGAADRRAVLRRRLLHERRRHRRCQHHRAQPDGQRPVCQARLLGKPRPRPGRFQLHRAVFPRSQSRRGLRPLPQRGRSSRVSPRSSSATPAAISDSAFRIADNTQMGLRYRFEREEIFDVANNASLAVKQSEGVVQRLEHRLHHRLRHAKSYRNSPTSGIFASFSQDLAGVGGDVNYFRSVVDARGYYPITNKITLVGRAQAGSITGWGGEDVRLTDLFFKGGETIRGFERAGYGPRDACENPNHRRARIELLAAIPSAASCSGRPPPRCASPSHSSPTASACRARFSSTRARCGSRASLPCNAVNEEGSFIFDSAAVRMSTGIQHHLAIAAWPAPRRYRAGPAQGRLRQDRGLPLRRFNELLKEAISRYGFASWLMSRRAPLRI